MWEGAGETVLSHRWRRGTVYMKERFAAAPSRVSRLACAYHLRIHANNQAGRREARPGVRAEEGGTTSTFGLPAARCARAVGPLFPSMAALPVGDTYINHPTLRDVREIPAPLRVSMAKEGLGAPRRYDRPMSQQLRWPRRASCASWPHMPSAVGLGVPGNACAGRKQGLAVHAHR